MTHDELQAKLRKAMGGKIPGDARPSWADFLRGKETEFWLSYEWIRANGFYRWVLECDDVDFGEGVHGLRVWIINFGRKGHGSSAV